jgi:hypothetical protein
MWKGNGKTTTLLFFQDSLFPKTEIYVRCFLWRQNNPEVNYSGSVSRGSIIQQALQQEGLQRRGGGKSQLQDSNVECMNLESRRQIGKFEKGNAEERGVCSRCQGSMTERTR